MTKDNPLNPQNNQKYNMIPKATN